MTVQILKGDCRDVLRTLPDKINAIIDAQRGLADVLLYLLESAVETPPHQSKEKS